MFHVETPELEPSFGTTDPSRILRRMQLGRRLLSSRLYCRLRVACYRKHTVSTWRFPCAGSRASTAGKEFPRGPSPEFGSPCPEDLSFNIYTATLPKPTSRASILSRSRHLGEDGDAHIHLVLTREQIQQIRELDPLNSLLAIPRLCPAYSFRRDKTA